MANQKGQVLRLFLHCHLAGRAKAAIYQLKLTAERLSIPLDTTPRVHLKASAAETRRPPSHSFTPVRDLGRQRRHRFPINVISFAPRKRPCVQPARERGVELDRRTKFLLSAC